MTKEKQVAINRIALYMFNNAFDEAIDEAKAVRMTKKRLRKCTAWVYETENFFLLKSYSTYVACIDKRSYALYDVLRYEYGYTATSSSHISKFFKDYAPNLKTAKKLVWRKL